MQVASLELCGELYELSGWGDALASWTWTEGIPRGDPYLSYPELERRWGLWGDMELKGGCPAYDLGYLLRKLPEIRLETWHNGQVVIKHYTANGVPGKLERKGEVIKVEADTPEDAACKLAIELFKKGILAPDVTDNNVGGPN